VIPQAYLSFFDDIQGIKGKTIQVFGFVEEYRGQPQIMLFFPSQIKKGDGSIFFGTKKIEPSPFLNLTEGGSWFKQ
jgi:hypothetical protein